MSQQASAVRLVRAPELSATQHTCAATAPVNARSIALAGACPFGTGVLG